MTGFRWQQIERLYNAALECDAPNRAEFVAEACAGDSDLRDEIESLLAVESWKTDALDRPAWEGAPAFSATGLNAVLLAQ